mgnify:CR=1 FL=1
MTGTEYQMKAMRTASSLDKDALVLNGVMGLNGETMTVVEMEVAEDVAD